jgi:hypothetical protein
MTKYRKKPVEIEAIQWDGMNTVEILEFARESASFKYHDAAWKVGAAPCVADLTILTLEGDHHASVGDFIIKGVKGEFYPCKPDIFEQTYEVVEDE